MRWKSIRIALTIRFLVGVLVVPVLAEEPDTTELSLRTQVKSLQVQMQNAAAKHDYKLAERLAQKRHAIHKSIDGADSWKTVDAEWDLRTNKKLASLTKSDLELWKTGKLKFDEANTSFQKGQYAKALADYRAALPVFEKVLTEKSPETASLYGNLASVLFVNGNRDDATKYLRKATAALAGSVGKEHPNSITAASNRARLLLISGKTSEAASIALAAKALSRESLGQKHLTTALCCTSHAAVLVRMGKYDEGIRSLLEAIDIYSDLEGSHQTAEGTAWGELGLAYQNSGKIALAVKAYERSLQLLGNRDLYKRSTAKRNLVDVYLRQGRNKEALHHTLDSLAISEFQFGKDHEKAMVSRYGLGRCYFANRKLPEALKEAKTSLAHFRRTGRDMLTVKAAILAANVLDGMGRYKDALEYYDEALNLLRRAVPKSPLHIGNCRFARGRHFGLRGNRSEALREYTAGIESISRVVKPHNPMLLRARFMLGTFFFHQGEYQKSAEIFREVNTMYLARRHELATDPFDRGVADLLSENGIYLAAAEAILGNRVAAWDAFEVSLGRVAADEIAWRNSTAPEIDKKLLQWRELAEKAETEVAIERLDGSDEANNARLAGAMATWKEALAKIKMLEGQLHEAHSLASASFELKRIQSAIPERTAIVGWIDIARMADVEDPDSTGKYLAVIVRRTGLPIWVDLGKHGLNQADHDQMLELRNSLVVASEFSKSKWEKLAENLSQKRFLPLMKYLEGDNNGLPPVNRIVVLPSSATNAIPQRLFVPQDSGIKVSRTPSGTVFAYLQQRKSKPSAKKLLAVADPVFDSSAPPLPLHGLLVKAVIAGSTAERSGVVAGDVLLSYAGVTLKAKSQLFPLENKQHPEKTLLIQVWRQGKVREFTVDPGLLGVSVFDKPAPQALANLQRGRKRNKDTRDAPPRLIGARLEALSIADLFDASTGMIDMLLDKQASEKKLSELARRDELSSYEHIFIGTHGETNFNDVDDSALLLAHEADSKVSEKLSSQNLLIDGRLTVSEVRSWRLKASLVTLSACGTGAGRQVTGDGALGFQQALLGAGARCVCLSLWQVNDAATALLMRRFYGNMVGRAGAGPMDKAAALSEASDWLRNLTCQEALELFDSLPEKVDLKLSRAPGLKYPSKALKSATSELRTMKPTDKPYKHPFFWAAFVLSGDAR